MANYTVTDGQNQSFSLLYPKGSYAVGYNTIDASGTAAMSIYVDGQENNTVNLAPNARISTTITTTHSSAVDWDIKGDATSLLIASGTNDISSSTTNFYAPVGGDGTFLSDTIMNIHGPVSAGVTFEADSGNIYLFNDATFAGNVTLNGGSLTLFGAETITDYNYTNGVATFYGGTDDHQIASFHLTDGTPGTSPITFGSGGGPITLQDGPLTSFEKVLPQHVAPVVQQPQPGQDTTPVVSNPPTTQPATPDQPTTTQPQQPDNPPATVADGTSGQQMPCSAQSYIGPVPGLLQEIVNITTRNLNILAHASGLFIHSGSGNDAIQAHGGTNVLDGGTGSNFLTAGTGTDTFFVDARGAAADTWSSIAKFHAGDAATLWGVSPSSAALSWSDNGGAAGYTGLTLHATAAGKPTASITLAGYSQADMAAGKVTASFGTDAASGSAYLYLHAT